MTGGCTIGRSRYLAWTIRLEHRCTVTGPLRKRDDGTSEQLVHYDRSRNQQEEAHPDDTTCQGGNRDNDHEELEHQGS